MNPKCPSSKPNSPKRFSKILKIFTTEFQFLAIVKNHKIPIKQCKAKTDHTGVPLGPRMDDTSVGLSLAQLADRARVPTPPMPPRQKHDRNTRRKKGKKDNNPNPAKVHTSSDDELTPTPLGPQYTSPHASPISPADPQTQMDITPPLSQSFAAASQSQISLDSSQMQIDSDSSQSQSSAAPKKKKRNRCKADKKKRPRQY